MAVEIKELIVRGIVNNDNTQTDVDIIEVVKEQIESYNLGLTSIQKKEIIQDCIAEMKSFLDRKSNF